MITDLFYHLPLFRESENEAFCRHRLIPFTRSDGLQIVIQDHSAGHYFGEGGEGDIGPHFNVRPIDDTRGGWVPGTLEHHPFGN